MGNLVTALVITLESDVHYVTTCVEFNCCWQCLQRDYSMIWHWNEHLLCSHKSLETEQQSANLILVQQTLVIGRKVVILYFLAMQQSSALQEQIKDDRYPSGWNPVMFCCWDTCKSFFPITQQTMRLKRMQIASLLWIDKKKSESNKTYMIDSFIFCPEILLRHCVIVSLATCFSFMVQK